jgi:hypothetical protein
MFLKIYMDVYMLVYFIHVYIHVGVGVHAYAHVDVDVDVGVYLNGQVHVIVRIPNIFFLSLTLLYCGFRIFVSEKYKKSLQRNSFFFLK